QHSNSSSIEESKDVTIINNDNSCNNNNSSSSDNNDNFQRTEKKKPILSLIPKDHASSAKSQTLTQVQSQTQTQTIATTPTPTPKSPCFVHSYIDPTLLYRPLSEIITICDNEPKNYSELAQTAVGVREISKKLGQTRIKSVMK